MSQSFDLLFLCLKSFLKNEKLNINKTEDETLGELFVLARKHDLAHLVSDVLYNSGVINTESEIAPYFKQAQFDALLRYTRQENATTQICQLFEDEKIAFMPLKGSVLRDFYREPYMRTSGDIDILVKEEDINKAKNALCEKLGYTVKEENKVHDISLYTPDGVHIELHFNILEQTENIDKVLDKVWDYTEESQSFKKSMTPEYFMFHHIAHMYYHFVNGGCGVRPFVDLYVLRENLNFSERHLKALCDECDITKFYYTIMELCDIWFCDGKHTRITKIIEEYILTGGVYGSIENKTAIKKTEEGNKANYILKRIFIPYNGMKYRYPVIKKYKFLYPATLVLRMIEALSPARRKRAFREMQMVKNINEHREKPIEEIIKFFELQ